MISILPMPSEQAKKMFAEQGFSVTENAAGVQATCGTETLGFCLFDLDEKGILVRALFPQDDALLADGILRAALHVAAERSAMDARYAETAPESLLMHLQFVPDLDEKRLDIDKLFKGCGCCEE